ALLTLNVQLGLYSVVVIPIVVGISLFFFVKVGDVFESFQEQEAILSNRLQENVTGVRVVKAFARQKFETDKFDVDNWEKFRRGRRLTRMHATYWPSTDILCGIQMVASFYIGARMAIEGIITPGTYIAASGLIIQIIWPIRNLGRLIADSSTGIVAFGRIQTIIREIREPLDQGTYKPTAELNGKVRFEDVNFAYSNGIPVLHDISFDVEPGQTVALLGSTGSGKTSMMGLLPRFYEYTGGRITIDGMELKEIPREYLRKQIGLVMQEAFLFSCSIRDNITYGVGRAVSDAEVEAAARIADVHEVILSFPKGYQTMVGERGVTLSGGQKQRVTLARTILKDPSILIMDDATSAVDTETESSIRTALSGVNRARTTFIIAHRIQSVMTADLVLVMDNGR
ncbi:MAG: ABC transporter ATP-binding protein, partial [Chloroflexi bacterium]|nr:ABC transporter ATP-binding protein [Chloroflexota bacterium]